MQKIKVSFDTWIQLLGMLGVLGGFSFCRAGNAAFKVISTKEEQNSSSETREGNIDKSTCF